jgi:hypothetical protein
MDVWEIEIWRYKNLKFSFLKNSKNSRQEEPENLIKNRFVWTDLIKKSVRAKF